MYRPVVVVKQLDSEQNKLLTCDRLSCLCNFKGISYCMLYIADTIDCVHFISVYSIQAGSLP
jgi:hypothetical protein